MWIKLRLQSILYTSEITSFACPFIRGFMPYYRIEFITNSHYVAAAEKGRTLQAKAEYL
jgi:hypothetical protein